MKKSLWLFGIALILGVFVGCSQQLSQSATPSPTATSAVTASPKAEKEKSDVWDEDTVFATLDKIDSDVLLATSDGQQRTYQYGESVAEEIELLEIQEGDDIAINFEIDEEGNYVVTSIEKTLAAR